MCVGFSITNLCLEFQHFTCFINNTKKCYVDLVSTFFITCYMDLVSTFSLTSHLSFCLLCSHVHFLSRLVSNQYLHNLYRVDINCFILPWHQHFISSTMKPFDIYVDMKYCFYAYFSLFILYICHQKLFCGLSINIFLYVCHLTRYLFFFHLGLSVFKISPFYLFY